MAISTQMEGQTISPVRIQLDKDGLGKPFEQHTRFKERFRIGRIDSALVDVKTNKPFSGKIDFFINKWRAASYEYIDGLANGKHTLYYADGKEWSIKSYVNGSLEGESYGYYQNGNMSAKSIYQNGIFISGFAYRENGSISAEYDRNTGIRKRYYESKSIFALDEFSKGSKPDKGDLPDHTTYYYPNGHKEKEGKEVYLALHVHDEEGHQERFNIIPTGHWIIYHESTGEKKEEGEFGLGGRHEDIAVRRGQWKIYDEKGKLLRYDYYEGFFGKVTRSEPAPEK